MPELPSLESIWPVQRRVDQPDPNPLDEIRRADNLPIPQAPPPVIADTLRQALAVVPAGQTTASTVEVIPPRHARPAVPVAQTKPANPAAAIAETHSAQLRTEDTPAQINTDIGLLPADLWQLINEPVPVSTPAPASTQPQQSMPSSSTQTSNVQRAILINEVDVHVDQPQQETERPSRQRSTQSAGPSGQTGFSDAQLDDLARKVYREIRQQLKIDWERTRRRS